MEETDNELTSVTSVDSEINELLGLFDAPAFVRRGQDVEYALGRLHERCRRERDEKLEMVRLRLRQWAAVATRPDEASSGFARTIEALWPLSGAEGPEWAARPASPRRQRTVARDLVAALTRFNKRWEHLLDGLNLEAVNRMIEQYNRYYVLEKECILGSTKLAARHFVPKARLTRDGLLDLYPLLPVPDLTALPG